MTIVDQDQKSPRQEDWHVRAPAIRSVPTDRAWQWLNKGWHDFEKSWSYGVFFGGVYALGGIVLVLLLTVLDAQYLVFPLICAFLFFGPIAAVGLYEISRRLEVGDQIEQRGVLLAFMRHGGKQIAMMGVVLNVFMLFWLKLAMMLFALFFGLKDVNAMEMLDMFLSNPVTIPFLLVGVAIGAILSAVAYMISVISFPFLLDKDADFITAMITSAKACTTNPLTMLSWGLILAAFTALSAVTFFLALIVVLPVIGHASWHAYRDLVDFD